ncbi:MAG: redoxin domain-containing protein [Dysgonamonadaceae bacterium]|jgi:hypothetical protein|nr:redoxin domain-containing protein [Dysgonamonadaceae bacterium]
MNNKIKKIIILQVLMIFIPVGIIFAENVNIYLPHFAGKPYVFIASKGDLRDTIQRGSLDGNGRVTLLPDEKYNGFTGVSKFMIVGEGGLEIIINGEPEFTVSCTEAIPNLTTISYKGSKENEFLFGKYLKQAEILEKYKLINVALQAYDSPDSHLHKPLLEEKALLGMQFDSLHSETSASALYAARIREFGNFITGIGSRLDLPENELRAEKRAFALEKLDFDILYNSGLWNEFIDPWISMLTTFGDSILISDIRKALLRIDSDDIKNKLLGKITITFYRYGKENLLADVGGEETLSAGHEAPQLKVLGDSINPANSIIIFYETGCRSCENELGELQKHYQAVLDNGMRVISVAADHDNYTFHYTADKFPWQDKLCDFKGVAGENFSAYKVLGTPTIFSVNNAGIVTGRYAKLAEYFDAKEK